MSILRTRNASWMGADASNVGQGWTVVAKTKRKVNALGFNKKSAIKKGLPIVTAVGTVDFDKDNVILVRVHEAINDASSSHALLSDFQVRDCVDKLCVVWKGHGGEQIFKPIAEASIPCKCWNAS